MAQQKNAHGCVPVIGAFCFAIDFDDFCENTLN